MKNSIAKFADASVSGLSSIVGGKGKCKGSKSKSKKSKSKKSKCKSSGSRGRKGCAPRPCW